MIVLKNEVFMLAKKLHLETPPPLGNPPVPSLDEGGLCVGLATPPCKRTPATETANTTAALCSTEGD